MREREGADRWLVCSWCFAARSEECKGVLTAYTEVMSIPEFAGRSIVVPKGGRIMLDLEVRDGLHLRV